MPCAQLWQNWLLLLVLLLLALVMLLVLLRLLLLPLEMCPAAPVTYGRKYLATRTSSISLVQLARLSVSPYLPRLSGLILSITGAIVAAVAAPPPRQTISAHGTLPRPRATKESEIVRSRDE